MRKLFVLALATSALQAAIIEGTVVENQTGHLIARASLRLEPLPGNAGRAVTMRTGRTGVFQFPNIAPGAYLLTATRLGFATVQYGQKQWRSAGAPIVVSANDTFAANIRLPRMGGIVGTVFDENDVGLPDHEVVAYRNTRPPQVVARGKSDDRGMYRISGLEPGTYLVRTAGKQYEENSYVPTFSKETQSPDQALPVQVELDRDADRVDIRPAGGRLYTLTVDVTSLPPYPAVTITLASEFGRETASGTSHRFTSLPAGQYEVFSQATPQRGQAIQTDYRKITVSRDDSVKITLRLEAETQFTFVGGDSGQVLARRKDLAGPGPTEVLDLYNGRTLLAAGPWQLAVPPTPAFYVTGFSGLRNQPPNDQRPDGWNEMVAGEIGRVTFTLSPNPGAIHGTVKSAGDSVAGAPVFLEPIDLEASRRITDTFMTRTDTRGRYEFTGLTPGNYRVLSSFEYAKADATIMTNAHAQSVVIEKGRDASQDLVLYVIP